MGEPGKEGEGHSANYNGIEGAATAESWLGRGAHLLEAGAHAFPAVEHMLGEAAEGVPILGAVAGGASAGLNLGLAIDDFSKEGAHSTEGYNHLGGAALGGAGAALSCTPYGAALAAGEIAADATGAAAGWAFGDDAKFSADSIAGGLIRGTVGDQSTGWAAGSAVSDALGGGVLGTGAGVLAGAATEAVALPYDLARTVGGGIYNEGAAIVNGIANGTGAVGGALNSAGHWVGDTASNVGGAIADGAGAAWDTVTSW